MSLNSSALFDCTEQDIERWNREWLEYLRDQWSWQLAPYTHYPEKPPLPDDPMDLLTLSVGAGSILCLYCDREALEGQRVMELGCGCGNLGKMIARYADSYLGTDYSTIALQIARLVSPGNCTYCHVSERKELESFAGQIDTVISRWFWIHQNLKLGRENLWFLENFVRPGGRVYADFFWPNPEVEHFIVLPPEAPLSNKYPSAQFRYDSEDVHRLIADLPFRILRETVSVPQERRYVVLERA